MLRQSYVTWCYFLKVAGQKVVIMNLWNSKYIENRAQKYSSGVRPFHSFSALLAEGCTSPPTWAIKGHLWGQDKAAGGYKCWKSKLPRDLLFTERSLPRAQPMYRSTGCMNLTSELCSGYIWLLKTTAQRARMKHSDITVVPEATCTKLQSCKWTWASWNFLAFQNKASLV